MQITIFGASGKVGNLVTEEALRRGYSVVAFTHSRDLFVPNNRLRVVKGDVHTADDVRGAVQGSDAVISALGSWGTKSRDIVSAAVRNVIPAMEAESIKRIVTLTGSGAVAPDSGDGIGHRAMLKLLSPFPVGKVFADGEQHMRLLAASKLDWTTIRSPVMNNTGSGSYYLRSEAPKVFSTIKRQAVANCMLDQLETEDFLRQAPYIHRG